MGLMVNCEWCDKQVERPPRALRKAARHFCCIPCRSAWRSQNLRGERSGTWKGGKVKVRCTVCDKELVRVRSQLNSSGNSFCDTKCQGVWMSKNRAGANHPLYKAGRRKYKRGYNWGTQRRKARTRDGYRCQVCQVTECKNKRSLDVHHIRPFDEFNGDVDAANDLLNLITMCQRCHKLAEHGKISFQMKLI